MRASSLGNSLLANSTGAVASPSCRSAPAGLPAHKILFSQYTYLADQQVPRNLNNIYK